MASVSLTRVIEKMKLENLTPEIDVKHVKITRPDINRPALQLAGYFEHFDATRLQIIGFVEYTYMEGLTDETRKEAYEKLMAYDIPCIVFSRDLKPDSIFLETAIQHEVPVIIYQEIHFGFYVRDHPLVKCQAGSLHLRTRRIGGCLR